MKALMKATSVFTAAVFIINTVLVDIALSATTTPQLFVDNSHASFSIDAMSVPMRSGEIKEKHKGSNGRTIIHIQDAHCNYPAQQSIAAMIQDLADSCGVDLVSVEGGRGKYNLRSFTRIGDRKLRRQIADVFVKEGRVSGPEFYAINNPGKVELFGIENDNLYKKNLEAYRSSLPQKAEVDKYLAALSGAIASLKAKVYSDELKALDAKADAYQGGTLDFKEYIMFLHGKSAALAGSATQYPGIRSIASLLADEKAIDFREAERERARLIDKLGKGLSKKDIEELAVKTAQFKQGDMMSEEFYAYLFRKARFSGVDFSMLPNLVKYSAYMKNYEAIDKSAIADEMKMLRDALVAKTAATDDQRALHKLAQDLAVIKGMFSISLIKEEFDDYTARHDDFRTDVFVSFINEKAPRYGLKTKLDGSVAKLDGYRLAMEKFYTWSLKRDNAFLRNIDAKLAGDGKNVTVLVTGGFHSGNLAKLFKDKGYSYIGVMPKFDASAVACPYLELLRGTESDLDAVLRKALTPPQSTIAIESLFSEMSIDQTRQLMVDLKIAMLRKMLATEPGEPFEFVLKTRWGGIVFTDDPATRGTPLAIVPGMKVKYQFRKPAKYDFRPISDLLFVDGSFMSQEEQELNIDARGIAAGRVPLTDKGLLKLKDNNGKQVKDERGRPLTMAGLRREFKTTYGLSDPQIDMILGQGGKRHNIFLWKRPIGNFLGHFGKREAGDAEGRKAARPESAEYGVAYASPHAATAETAAEIGATSHYRALAWTILHEVGEIYRIRHTQVVDIGAGDKEMADFAAKVVSSVMKGERVKIARGTAAMAPAAARPRNPAVMRMAAELEAQNNLGSSTTISLALKSPSLRDNMRGLERYIARMEQVSTNSARFGVDTGIMVADRGKIARLKGVLTSMILAADREAIRGTAAMTPAAAKPWSSTIRGLIAEVDAEKDLLVNQEIIRNLRSNVLSDNKRGLERYIARMRKVLSDKVRFGVDDEIIAADRAKLDRLVLILANMGMADVRGTAAMAPETGAGEEAILRMAGYTEEDRAALANLRAKQNREARNRLKTAEWLMKTAKRRMGDVNAAIQKGGAKDRIRGLKSERAFLRDEIRSLSREIDSLLPRGTAAMAPTGAASTGAAMTVEAESADIEMAAWSIRETLADLENIDTSMTGIVKDFSDRKIGSVAEMVAYLNETIDRLSAPSARDHLSTVTPEEMIDMSIRRLTKVQTELRSQAAKVGVSTQNADIEMAAWSIRETLADLENIDTGMTGIVKNFSDRKIGSVAEMIAYLNETIERLNDPSMRSGLGVYTQEELFEGIVGMLRVARRSLQRHAPARGTAAMAAPAAAVDITGGVRFAGSAVTRVTVDGTRLPAMNAANKFGGLEARLVNVDGQIAPALTPDLFKYGEESLIPVAVENEEQAARLLAQYYGSASAVRAAGDHLWVIRMPWTKVTRLIYVNNQKGREGVVKAIKDSGVPASRVATFAYAQSVDADGNPVMDALDKELKALSCQVVYMTGQPGGQTVTPIALCMKTGEAILNQSLLEMRKKTAPETVTDEDLLKSASAVATGLIAISGSDVDPAKMLELAKKIMEAGLSNTLLFVKLRPIDLGMIKQFHDAEVQVLKSL